MQQTCFTKYRNEGQKTSLIEELWRWEKYMDSLVFRFAKNSFAITQLEYLNVLHQISNHSKGQVWFHIISPAVAYMEQGKALSIWWNPFTTSFWIILNQKIKMSFWIISNFFSSYCDTIIKNEKARLRIIPKRPQKYLFYSWKCF